MERSPRTGSSACRRLCLERQDVFQSIASCFCDNRDALEWAAVLWPARQAIKGNGMKSKSAKTVRCAIYTRVSTDQGLEQDFNSLDAQYDAAQAYIRSQAHAGWTLLR